MATVEMTLTASHAMVNIAAPAAPPVMAHAEVFNGAIPGPTINLVKGDTLIVRLINELDHELSIHWHGIELANSADGTEVTQGPVAPLFAVPPPPPAPIGGTYLYKFIVKRAGLFWYHPHHHGSINRTFRGLYGMIVVTDDVAENALILANVIPDAASTQQIVLSDITVCKAVGSNPADTYDTSVITTWPWAGGGSLPAQPAPGPFHLCEANLVTPAQGAHDDEGNPTAVSYGADDVPSLIRGPGRVNEGQTVLTNGVNVGARAGSPDIPGAVDVNALTIPVAEGQTLRLQLANCAVIRYFRLRLTDAGGGKIDLIRIGGEGGLLTNAVKEGGTIAGFITKYDDGEILLAAGSRADVTAMIPAGTAGTTLTLWTLDFQRTGQPAESFWTRTPSVPVLHLAVAGAASGPTIADSTPILAAIGGSVPPLGAPDDVFIDAAAVGKVGTDDPIEITLPPGFNSNASGFEGFDPYTTAPHYDKSRFALIGKTLQVTVKNNSTAHHPYHLHGFSFQPVSLTHATDPPFNWTYNEFRDNLDIPGGYTLTFRVHLEDRELVDGATMGGALGRWLYHCHIFFHHHHGMISELVVCGAPDCIEKPDIDVNGSWAYSPDALTPVTRTGRFYHRDSLAVTLSTTLGTIAPVGPVVASPAGDDWTWSFLGSPQTTYVYGTATDSNLREDQTVWRIKIGPPDDGADIGDPHIHTVDGKRYDFQAAGEFTLLRDPENGLEIQARQTPVLAANPITDSYSGLKTCVSVNTAVAARVGEHRISYQPYRERDRLLLFVDCKPVDIPRQGLDLGANRVTAEEVNGGGVAIRVDYASYAVLVITPYFWTTYGVWLLNVSVARTPADRGVMGAIPTGTWLPALANGSTVGPMPGGLAERFDVLYRTFADSWRVTDESSLFEYMPGTSTATFTDRNWPAGEPPCKLLPQFEVPGGTPVLQGMDVKRAEKVCRNVKNEGLHQDCVFDVATTGDEVFALGAELAQEIRLRGSGVTVTVDNGHGKPGEPVCFTATVSSLYPEGGKAKGSVTFIVDGVAGRAVKLDGHGQAKHVVRGFKAGEHRIRAVYAGHGKRGLKPCSSATLVHMVGERPPHAGGGGHSH